MQRHSPWPVRSARSLLHVRTRPNAGGTWPPLPSPAGVPSSHPAPGFPARSRSLCADTRGLASGSPALPAQPERLHGWTRSRRHSTEATATRRFANIQEGVSFLCFPLVLEAKGLGSSGQQSPAHPALTRLKHTWLPRSCTWKRRGEVRALRQPWRGPSPSLLVRCPLRSCLRLPSGCQSWGEALALLFTHLIAIFTH